MLIVEPPLPVLAVHDLGLRRVQFQPDARQPLRQRVPDLPGLPLGRAVHHRVVGIALELHGRELALQPRIERVVQEQVRQYG